jgi:hypothetical protein
LGTNDVFNFQQVVGHSKKVEATTTSFSGCFGVGLDVFVSCIMLKINAF